MVLLQHQVARASPYGSKVLKMNRHLVHCKRAQFGAADVQAPVHEPARAFMGNFS
jgi:hypothetical protein